MPSKPSPRSNGMRVVRSPGCRRHREASLSRVPASSFEWTKASCSACHSSYKPTVDLKNREISRTAAQKAEAKVAQYARRREAKRLEQKRVQKLRDADEALKKPLVVRTTRAQDRSQASSPNLASVPPSLVPLLASLTAPPRPPKSPRIVGHVNDGGSRVSSPNYIEFKVRIAKENTQLYTWLQANQHKFWNTRGITIENTR